MQAVSASSMNASRLTGRAGAAPAPRHPAAAGAATQRAAHLRTRASWEEAQRAVDSNPLFTSQFMGVLQDSLARQGADALTGASANHYDEPRTSATEEVLTAALQQSKQTLQQLVAWREQVDRQIAAQQKQVDRMEFALSKSRNDAAYMRALKEMLHGDL